MHGIKDSLENRANGEVNPPPKGGGLLARIKVVIAKKRS